MWQISPARHPRWIEIRFPYDQHSVDIVRTIPDRRWDAKNKLWKAPISQLGRIQKTLTSQHIAYTVDSRLETILEQLRNFEKRLLDEKRAYVPGVGSTIQILGLKTKPYQFQYDGIRYLSLAQSAILADCMGAGKSLMSIATALYTERTPALIFCESTKKEGWGREIEKHSDAAYIVIDGPKKKRKEQWARDADFYICTWDSVLSDKEEIYARKWKMIIGDEANAIKTAKAQTTKAAKKIPSDCRIALTGTPVENNLEELHSLMDWVQPGVLGSRYSFITQYANKDFFGNIVGYRPGAIDDIRQIIAPYVLRREKADILPFLPPKIALPDLVVTLSSAQRRAYNQIVKDAIADPTFNPLTLTLRLKQFTSSPLLVGMGEKGPKLEELGRILGRRECRYLVFSEFAEMVKILAEEFQCPSLHGKTRNRQQVIDEFNNGDAVALFSSRVANKGVEITAADVVVHFDTPWNPALIEQREDRVHRIGVDHTVSTLRLIAAKTIDDERVAKVVQQKLNLKDRMMTDIDAARVAKTISREDWGRMLVYDEAD